MVQTIGRWERYGLIESPARPLTFGLIVDDPARLTRWQDRCVRLLTESGVARPKLVIAPRQAHRRSRADVRSHLCYYAVRATVWRTSETRSLAAGALLADVPIRFVRPTSTHGRWVAFPDEDVAAVRAADLDFVLRFGMGLIEGEILEAARHGIWSLHHGDERRYRGRPAGFWELHDGATEIGVIVQRLTSRLDGGRTLQRAIIGVDQASYGRTLDRLYRVGAELPFLLARDIILETEMPSSSTLEPTSASVRHLPGSRATAKVLARTTASAIRRWFYGAFILKRWTIGTVDGGRAAIVRGGVAVARWIPSAAPRTFLADPWFVPGSGGRVVLAESMDYSRGRGAIVRLELDRAPAHVRSGADPVATSVATIVELADTHLSYPSLVTHDGELLCIPEAAATSGAIVVRLDPSATIVRGVEPLFHGFAAIDPTVFEHGGRWWLACTEDGTTALTHLWLFHADGPLGPWRPHRRNPVRIDVRSARPGGAPFVHDGTLLRPTQDSRGGYGRAITMLRVVRLDPDDYAEEFAGQVLPDPHGACPDGLHTVAIDGDFAVIDGYRDVVNPLAGWYRLKARYRRRSDPRRPLVIERSS